MSKQIVVTISKCRIVKNYLIKNNLWAKYTKRFMCASKIIRIANFKRKLFVFLKSEIIL